nr:junctional sarcoplasmic reticulum protein 1 isoform X2 [Gorilla gorilla gorilla]
MTTRAWEELDGGLGSCQALEDHSALAETQEDRASATPRLADSGSVPHDSQVAEGPSVDTRPKKMEKEPAARGTPGTGKERLKAGASGFAGGPRSAPARKKAQTAPPLQPPPPPPPALSEELPWGDLSLNKCLVLASLVALLGLAFQLCRDAVAGEAALQARVPEPWVPPSSAPREPSSPLPKFEAQAPPSAPPAPRAEAEVRPKIPGSREAAEKDEEEPGEATGEAVRENRVPLADRGPKERPRREGKPRKEKPRKEERPKKERPRKEERPRAAREPQEALPRRWESREGGHRPWARDSRDAEPRKKQAWVSPRRPDEEQRPGSRQKLRAGKGRD